MKTRIITLLMICSCVMMHAQPEHGISLGGGTGMLHVVNYHKHLTSMYSDHVFVSPGPTFRAGYYRLLKTPVPRLKLETGLHTKVMSTDYIFHLHDFDCQTGRWSQRFFEAGLDWLLYFQIPAEFRWEQMNNWYLKAGPVFGYAVPIVNGEKNFRAIINGPGTQVLQQEPVDGLAPG